MSVPKGTYLVMQKTAGGSFMSVKYKDGDRIKVVFGDGILNCLVEGREI